MDRLVLDYLAAQYGAWWLRSTVAQNSDGICRLQGYTVYGHSIGHPQGIHTWFRMVGYVAMDHRQPWYQGVTNADLQQLGHEPCAHFCGTHKNGRRRPLCAFFCSAASVMLVLLSSMVNNRLRRVMVSYICMHYMYLRRVCRVQGSGCMEMESSDGILACHAVASSTIKGRGMGNFRFARFEVHG